MQNQWLLSPDRTLTPEEQSLLWIAPPTHIVSDAQRRIRDEVKRNWTRGEMKITTLLLEGDAGSGKTQLARALSADFGLPYTKVTCFADMDKSDVLGAILPVVPKAGDAGAVRYRYYPSEIIRAYERGWLLEIQEPTAIRDAAVLMALNSALEPDGCINLPTRIARRHPDFIAVITSNRGYNGCRPLNEALRDRVQHTERMELPAVEVMVERAAAKTGCADREFLSLLARAIVLLDQTATANAIRGVAGMRSYFFWADAVLQGDRLTGALYHKVLYKITTDPDELLILEQALAESGVLDELENAPEPRAQANDQTVELRAESIAALRDAAPTELPFAALIRSADGGEAPDHGDRGDQGDERAVETVGADTGESGKALYHTLQAVGEESEEARREFRRHLNEQARELIRGSPHERVNLIVHRPRATPEHRREYRELATALLPVIRELTRKTMPLLEHEISCEQTKGRVYGTQFHAEALASPDFRCFSKPRPPGEEPSLIVALRIDESASMNSFGRLEAAKSAAVAVYEFCENCGIPLLIYGDTADRSPLERMSLYAYIDSEHPSPDDKYSLMAMQGRSNNRDGMALRILAEKLVRAPQKTRLLISVSDGQPRAIPDYTGAAAVADMKGVLREYSRRGVLFLAAAIGQDKETICDIYGRERFMDITDLRQLPARLVRLIANYL